MSGFGTGLDSQIGIGTEASYGTYIAPTRFYEFNSESIVPTVAKLYSRPLGAGRTQKTGRRRTFITGGGGAFEIDAVSKGLGLLLEHMLGSVSSQQIASTDEYQHTFVKSANGKRTKSATVQVGRPSVDGTVRPFSYTGGKIIAWAMTAALDDILKIATTWDFQDETTEEALAVANYPTGAQPFTFLDGTLTIDGSGIGTVNNVALNWAESMNVARRSFGNTKNEPLANGELAITGQFGSEFTDMNGYNAWVAGTEIVDLVLTFLGGDIGTTGNPYKLVATIPSLEYTGSAPNVSGPDVVPQNLPFKALDNETDEILTIDYHTDDTAP